MKETALDSCVNGAASPEVYVAERRRWTVLGAFMYLTCTNNILWMTFSPIRAASAHYYGVSGVAIDNLSLVYMYVYPLCAILFAWYAEPSADRVVFGLKASAVLNFIAAGLRWASTTRETKSFALVFFGQTLAAISQGATLAAPPRLASTWFLESEWGLATGLGVFANQLGPVVAFYCAPALVPRVGVSLAPAISGVEIVFVDSCASSPFLLSSTFRLFFPRRDGFRHP